MTTVTATFPTSPALARALDQIGRAFANKHGKAKSMSKTMLRIGAHHCATRARYGDLARRIDDMRLNLDDTIKHLRFAYLCESRPYERQILKEAIILSRWIRRFDARGFYWVRDALTIDQAFAQAAE